MSFKALFKFVVMFVLFFTISNCDDQKNSCGGTYAETEASGSSGGNDGGEDSTSNFLMSGQTVDDFGITLTQGCKVTITGYMENGPTSWDYFRFNTGNDVDGILFEVSWSGDTDLIDLYIMDSFNNNLYATESSKDYTSRTDGYENFIYYTRGSNLTRYILISTEDPSGLKAGLTGGIEYSLSMEAY